jgi:hypothetical protein
MTKFIQANGGILDTANLGADWISCFSTPLIPGSASFNLQPPAPQPLSIAGAKGSTADPTADGTRKVIGVVPGTSIVFGN